MKEEVSHFNDNKSPSPIGFNFPFFKRFWSLLRVYVRVMFEEFHRFSYLTHNFASSFVTLITKVKSHCFMGYFRPISIVGYIYKLIAKVLANRLGSVMEKLISPN